MGDNVVFSTVSHPGRGVQNLSEGCSVPARVPGRAELFRSFRFFEFPTEADTEHCSVERPCFLLDHIKPPCTEDRPKVVSHKAYEAGPSRFRPGVPRSCENAPP